MKSTVSLHIVCLLILCIHGLMHSHAAKDYIREGIIKVRIADMNNSFPPPSHPGASPDIKGCPRAHQALFLEKWRITAQEEHAVQLYKNGIRYKDGISTFWMAKDAIISLDELPENVIDALPGDVYGEKPTVVLTYPWNGFSVGTRFKHDSAHDTTDHYAVIIPDFSDLSISTYFIPKENVVEEIAGKSNAERRDCFVTQVKRFIERITKEGNIIPYVWGGSSYVGTYTDGKDTVYKQDGNWQRVGPQSPYTGFDCSELVIRWAATIAGIDFPYKTTTIMANSLKELDLLTDTLENGDLLWYKGHVVIIIDKDNSKLAEARGYSSGFGKVHIISIEDAFDGICTISDLLDLLKHNLPLRLKAQDGSIVQDYAFKIFKLI